MRRNVAGPLIALLLAISLVACGDGEGPDGEGPTISPTRSATREPPSSNPSESPEGSESAQPEPSSTPTEEPEPTSDTSPSDRVSDRESDRPSDRPSDRTSEPQSELDVRTVAGGIFEPGAEPDDGDASTDDETPTWPWWLLAALVIGAAVAIPLLVRRRRRAAWRQRLAEAEAELGWLARELLPSLRHVGSVEQVAGGWTVGSPRVLSAEDELTALESTAHDDAGRDRARALRDACRLARVRMEQLVAPRSHDTWALDLDAIMADLEAALGPAPTART